MLRNTLFACSIIVQIELMRLSKFVCLVHLIDQKKVPECIRTNVTQSLVKTGLTFCLHNCSIVFVLRFEKTLNTKNKLISCHILPQKLLTKSANWLNYFYPQIWRLSGNAVLTWLAKKNALSIFFFNHNIKKSFDYNKINL